MVCRKTGRLSVHLALWGSSGTTAADRTLTSGRGNVTISTKNRSARQREGAATDSLSGDGGGNSYGLGGQPRPRGPRRQPPHGSPQGYHANTPRQARGTPSFIRTRGQIERWRPAPSRHGNVETLTVPPSEKKIKIKSDNHCLAFLTIRGSGVPMKYAVFTRSVLPAGTIRCTRAERDGGPFS